MQYSRVLLHAFINHSHQCFRQMFLRIPFLSIKKTSALQRCKQMSYGIPLLSHKDLFLQRFRQLSSRIPILSLKKTSAPQRFRQMSSRIPLLTHKNFSPNSLDKCQFAFSFYMNTTRITNRNACPIFTEGKCFAV